jgi:hypothetical protein
VARPGWIADARRSSATPIAFATVAEGSCVCNARSVTSASSKRFRLISERACRKRPSREKRLSGRIAFSTSSAF